MKISTLVVLAATIAFPVTALAQGGGGGGGGRRLRWRRRRWCEWLFRRYGGRQQLIDGNQPQPKHWPPAKQQLRHDRNYLNAGR